MLRRSAAQRSSPLAPPLRRLWRILPLGGFLGLLAGVLEGAGIGLFIPLISLLLSNSSATGVPLLGHAVTLLGNKQPHTAAAILAGGILALILLKGLVEAASDSLSAYVEGRIGSDVRRSVATKLLELEYPFFLTADRTRLSHIVVTDCWFVQDAAHFVLNLIPAIAALLVFAALLAWLNFKLFVVVLVAGAAVQAMLRLFERRQSKLGLEFNVYNQRLWDRLLGLIQAPRVIRLFGQQQGEEENPAPRLTRCAATLFRVRSPRRLPTPSWMR